MKDKKNSTKTCYTAFFDIDGNIVFPTSAKEVEHAKKIMGSIVKDNVVFNDEEQKWYSISSEMITLNNVRYKSVSMFDITDFIDEISHASFDEITNLSTRRSARDLFISYIEHAYENQEDFAVIMADLDGFKEVNDTYGHLAGDRVLKAVSDKLRDSVRHDPNRDSDIVARLGGDEFIVILKNITEEYAEERAEEIRKEVDELTLLVGEDDKKSLIKPGTLSVGLYYVPYERLAHLFEKGYSLDEIRVNILNKTDALLYVSKNNGKNKVTSYSKDPIRKLI